jgi:hypothetical protein
MPKLWDKPKPQATVARAPTSSPPVAAGQINDRNAGQMAGALSTEIDQSVQQASYTTTDSAPCKH